MIRFSCPHCGREYLLADALAHLALICKGCGQRLTVPDPEPEPPPAPLPPPPPPKPAPVPEPQPRLREGEAPAEPKVVARQEPRPPEEETPARQEPRPPEKHIPTPESADEPFISPETLAQLDEPAQPSTAGTGTTPAGHRNALARVADAAAFLVLLVAGALLGEVVARKPTGEILSGAGSAPKFPPTDLMLWLGCVVFFGLVYAWLGTRGWTVGGWLKRRAS